MSFGLICRMFFFFPTKMRVGFTCPDLERSSCLRLFYKIAFPKYSINFIRKHPQWSPWTGKVNSKQIFYRTTPDDTSLVIFLDHFGTQIITNFTCSKSTKETTIWCEICLKLTKTTQINPFQCSVAFHIETSHLVCRAKQMTGVHVACKTGLK